MNLDPNALRILKHNLVQLAPVSVKHRARLVSRRVLLVYDDLARVEFVDVEAVVLQVDGDFAHLGRDGPVGPAVEDAARVGPEGYDVAEDFEGREGLVDDGRVAVADAFYGCGEAAETWGWWLVGGGWDGRGWEEVPAPMIITLMPVFGVEPLLWSEAMVENSLVSIVVRSGVREGCQCFESSSTMAVKLHSFKKQVKDEGKKTNTAPQKPGNLNGPAAWGSIKSRS